MRAPSLTLLAFVVSALTASLSTPALAGDSMACPAWLMGVGNYLRDQATQAWKVLVNDREFHRQRYAQNFPAIRAAFVENWQAKLSQLPEGNADATTEAALEALRRMRGTQVELRRDRRQVYGQSLRLPESSLLGFVKESHTRLQIDAPTATDQVTVGTASRSAIHDARWEVMAFQMDRFLGSNLVPPAFMTTSNQSVQLLIPSQAADYAKAVKDPQHLLDISMIRVLDAIFSNSDRAFPGNFRITKQGRALAVDFDLSAPVPALAAAVRKRLMINDFPIASGWLGNGQNPGVYSRRMLEKLRALTPDDVWRMAKDGEARLSEAEARGIYSGAKTALQVIEDLAQEFGEDLVLVP